MSKRNQFKALLSSSSPENLGASQKEQIVSQFSSHAVELVPENTGSFAEDRSTEVSRTEITKSESKTMEESQLKTIAETPSKTIAQTTEFPASATQSDHVSSSDEIPGGFDTLDDLIQRFRYLHYDYYEGSLQSDHLVEDDYTNKSVWIDKSMLQEIEQLTSTMRKKKGFHKQIMNTGLRIAIDLYKLQLDTPKK